jgi:hypothetical protein
MTQEVHPQVCQACGSTQDVRAFTLDMDLPTVRACSWCAWLLVNPEAAEQLGFRDPWRSGRN